MKTIRTRRAHEAVTLPAHGKDDGATVTVGRNPLTVSNEAADQYEKAAAAVGVDTVVVDDDAPDSDDSDSPDGLPSGGVVDVDPTKGVVAATGSGDPVTTTKAAAGGATKGK